MSDITEAIELASAGNSRAATDMLREEFEKLQTPERMVELCEWIATCFENLDDYVQAGSWYEMAGELILSDRNAIYPIRAFQAVNEYERALECYYRGEEEEFIERCSAIVHQLRSSCAGS
jgi:tetratricopeptide (TPR) repeat protein